MPAGGTYLCEEVARVWRVCGVCVACVWRHALGVISMVSCAFACSEPIVSLQPRQNVFAASGESSWLDIEQTQYEQLRCRLTTMLPLARGLSG